jgi:hypothetical protein
MKVCFAPIVFAMLAPAAGLAQLSQVHSVYLLPMGNGLDQYLANRLTESGVFQVVTDPMKADAIFSDRLGETLEQRLRDFNPPPPKEEKKDADKKEEDKKEVEKKDSGLIKDDRTRPVSSFSRGKGNIFLVDRKSGNLVWSHFEKPRNFTPEELSRTAQRIVQELKRDMGAK